MRRLDLSNFRCYGGLRLETGPASVVLTGLNGAGKTNLLEALSFLVPGRGLRRARLSDVRRHGAPEGWAVAAQVSGPYGTAEIGTGEAPAAAEGESPERRVVHIDGRAQRGQAALAEYVNALWLTPDMDQLFLDAASHRRRFLDRIVAGFDPAHARRAAAYDHALRERARLLREARAEGREADPAWCAALEERMASEGVALAASRRSVVARLDAASAAPGPFPRARLAVAGSVEDWLGAGPALEAEERFRHALVRSRRIDAETGGAAEGPHRSDLRVWDRAKNMPAEQCSTGEQKALLLSIVLAVARLQGEEGARPPLLLLDEVVAHLDVRRRAALFDELHQQPGQAWLTGTDPSLFAGFRGAQFFDVVAGALRPRAA